MLVLVVIAGLGLFVLAIAANPFGRNAEPLPGKSEAPAAVSGNRIMMDLPRLAGFTRDSRPYELSARAAAQDLTTPDKVELIDIRAKVEMQDKVTVSVHAPSGIFDSKSERLTLGRDIVLMSSSGYEGRLQEAVIDVRAGQIVSEKPLEVKLLNGMLNANRLEIDDKGALIRFDSGVSMVLTFPDKTAAAREAGQ